MKLRLFCVVAALFAFVGVGHAANTGKKDAAQDKATKQLTIPSVEMGGYSVDLSTKQPDDPNVPTFQDPATQDHNAVVPYFGLHLTKPLGK
jgi:hypothetical protein